MVISTTLPMPVHHPAPASASAVMMTDVCKATAAITPLPVWFQSKVSYFHCYDQHSQNKIACSVIAALTCTDSYERDRGWGRRGEGRWRFFLWGGRRGITFAVSTEEAGCLAADSRTNAGVRRGQRSPREIMWGI